MPLPQRSYNVAHSRGEDHAQAHYRESHRQFRDGRDRERPRALEDARGGAGAAREGDRPGEDRLEDRPTRDRRLNSSMTPCACGCGRAAPIATKTSRRYSVVKGQPRRFIQGHGSRGRRGPGHPTWRGGRHLMDGYVFLRQADHQRAHANGYIAEHLIVAEVALGHPLPLGAVIHHRNENRADNRPDNLVICQDRAYHVLLHARLTAYRATGDPNARRCKYCHRWVWVGVDGAVAQTSGGRKAPAVVHLKCRNAYERRRYHRRQELRP